MRIRWRNTRPIWAGRSSLKSPSWYPALRKGWKRCRRNIMRYKQRCARYSSCRVLSHGVQVETAHSRPQSRSAPGGANRRLQMLMKQSERLEAQLRELESEILTMVSCGSFIHHSMRPFHPFNDCHEGSDSETTVDSTSNVIFPTTGWYSWILEGCRTGLTPYPCYSILW